MIEKPYYRLAEVAEALNAEPLAIVDLANHGMLVLHAKVLLTGESFESEPEGHSVSPAEMEGLALGLVLLERTDIDTIAKCGAFPREMNWGHRMVHGTLKLSFFDTVQVTAWHLCVVHSEFKHLETVYQEARLPKPANDVLARAPKATLGTSGAIEVVTAPHSDVAPAASATPECADVPSAQPERVVPTPEQIKAWGPALADRLCNKDSGEWTEQQKGDLIALYRRCGNASQASIAIGKGISSRRISELMTGWGIEKPSISKSRDVEKTQINNSLNQSEPRRNPFVGYSDLRSSREKLP